MLSRTVFGRWLYAAGQNATAAHISGVPVSAISLAAYIASGFCAALASVMLTGRLETGSPVMGREILLDIIGATVVGGTSLFGGRGSVWGTLAGVFFIGLRGNGLNLHNVEPYNQQIVKGVVLLAATSLDLWRGKERL